LILIVARQTLVWFSLIAAPTCRKSNPLNSSSAL
jgi:hypothetical protein